MITWNILRAAGIGAYVMLWASVAWGLISTTAVFGRKISKATTVALHQAFSTSGLLLLATHLFFLLKDQFMPFTPLDFLIPMRATYRPVGVALGIGAMFVMLLGVLSTSWGRKLIGTKWWRRTHSLSVPAFALALVHGLMTGTDTQRPALYWMYVATAAILLFLLLVRGFTAGERPQRAKLPEGVVRRTPATPVERVTAPRPVGVHPVHRVREETADPDETRPDPGEEDEPGVGEPTEPVRRRKTPFAVRPIPAVVVQAAVPPAPFRIRNDSAEPADELPEVGDDWPVLEGNPDGAAASFGATTGAGGRRYAGGNGHAPANAHADPTQRGSHRGHAPRPHPSTRSPDHPGG